VTVIRTKEDERVVSVERIEESDDDEADTNESETGSEAE